MIFAKSTMPIFYIEGVSEKQEKELGEIKETSHTHRTETGIYIFPNPECNWFDWEMDIREILKTKSNEKQINH